MARTPQQNGVAEKKNRTLIEAIRTMLVDSKLPTTFWAEAVNTAWYVLNRVLVIKPHNKTPYELIRGKPPLIDFMKPFRCPVTILNTRDHLGKFDGKANEGYFVGYSVVSKAMRVFNKRTRIVEETLNIRFIENTPNVKGNGPDWLFDVDSLSISMNYVPVVAGNKTNGIAGTKDTTVVGPKDRERDTGMKPTEADKNEASDTSGKYVKATKSKSKRLNQKEMQTKNTNSTNGINTVSTPVSTAGPTIDTVVSSPLVNTARPSVNTANAFEEHLFERFSPFKNAFSLPPIPHISSMDNTGIFGNAYDDEDVEEEVDMNNANSSYIVPDTYFTKFHKVHPKDQVIGSLETLVQTRHMTKTNEEHGLISSIHQLRRTNHKDFQNCLFACFLSQKEPKKVFRNKDERGIVVKNKARLVAQGHTQEEGIDYDEVFAPVARIEAIRLFLAYASFKDFVVYQMDVKSVFLYGKIEKEVYVCQPPGFEDPYFPNKVYKVEKALYGLHQASRAWYETLLTYLLDNGFYRGKIDKTLFIRRHKDDILLVQVYVDDIIFRSIKKEMSIEFEKFMHDNQDKYVAEILKKFDFSSIKIASTPIETIKPLIKDEEAENVDVHLFQVTPKSSHLYAVKRIFRYLKRQPKLSPWYPRDSPFDLEAFSDSDYAGASLDRKSTIGEYVAAANCCGQVFWIQNQMLDYGYNLMNTNIYIDNESTICIVKNPVYHSKTKHIEIRHHFIRDSYEKKLIQVIKIYTDKNVADLLTKAFDVSRKVGDEAIYKELVDKMEKAAITASSSEAEHDSVNAVRRQLLLLVQVPAAEGDSINTSIKDFTYFFIRFHSFKHSLNTSPNSISSLIIKIIIMSSPNFAETYNVVAFMEKPAESDGFTEIIDFLKASSLQALIDKKKVIIMEASIRTDLHLDDAEGTDCLSNTTIFEELAKMGLSAKTTAWNEFSITMASLIICLAKNRIFNLSKYIFDAMVKHLDEGVKFLLYPRFLQVFINTQLGDMSHHKKTFVNPFHTKKIFANMKREGKDFFGRVTPLFDSMLVQAFEEMGEDSIPLSDSTQIPIINQPSTSTQPKKKQKSRRKQRKEAEVANDETEQEEYITTPSSDPLPSEKAKTDQATEIASLKRRVNKLEKRRQLRTTGLKRFKKFGTARRAKSTNADLGAQEDASKQGRSIEDIDADVEVTLVNETLEQQNDDLMFDTGFLDDDEVFVEDPTSKKDEQGTKLDDSTASKAITTASVEDRVAPTIKVSTADIGEVTVAKIDELTLAQTLIEIKAAKPKVVTTAATTTTTIIPKAKGVVVQEPSEFRVPQEAQPSISKVKGKGIMVEPEVPLKRKDKITLDEQIARDIQAKLDAELEEEQKLARKQEEEANIALIESWENTQAMMEADRLLAERLQSKEREELIDEEKVIFFMELMEKRRKHFAALRA
ncbi:putative ribonuclease H-like domain-containing protein [Tanacetum coccineum]